jgi:hypothetical protein
VQVERALSELCEVTAEGVGLGATIAAALTPAVTSIRKEIATIAVRSRPRGLRASVGLLYSLAAAVKCHQNPHIWAISSKLEGLLFRMHDQR